MVSSCGCSGSEGIVVCCGFGDEFVHIFCAFHIDLKTLI